MARQAGCPFAPPPDVMALAEERPLSRVRIWDGSTPWLITGYEQCRELFSDSRVSVDDRVPGFPHWNAGMLSTVHKRPRSVFTSDGEEHTRFRRMLSKPFTFKRVEGSAADHPADHRRPHRRDAGRAAARRYRRRAGAAGAVPGDQPVAGGAVRGRRDVPAPRQCRAGALCDRRGHRQRRDEPAQIPLQSGRGQDGDPPRRFRGRGFRSGRTGQSR